MNASRQSNLARPVDVRSPIAEAMGAKVNVTGPGQGMYLIAARDAAPDRHVVGRGGQIVLQLNRGRVLATLPFEGYLSLRASRDIAFIGPVNVDVQRLAKFSQMLARPTGGGT